MQRAHASKPLCWAGWLGLAVGLAGCGGHGSAVTPQALEPYTTALCTAVSRTTDGYGLLGYQQAFPYVFNEPTAFVQHPSGTWYVAEKKGVIYSFNKQSTNGPEPILDLKTYVSALGAGGLLGLTIAPTGEKLYVLYTAEFPYRSVLERYSLLEDGRLVADRIIIFEIPHDKDKNTALSDQLAFGPDGYLYVAIGDDDSIRRAQDKQYLAGAILRLNVNAPDAARGTPYSIPSDNPYATSGYCADTGCPELGMKGLHQPGGMRFDPITANLWIHDRGGLYDEINRLVPKDNAGWPCYDGNTVQSACSATVKPPVLALPREQMLTIVNGGVYRGGMIEDLYGDLLFADQSSGRIYAMHDPYNMRELQPLLDTNMQVSYFSTDLSGEWYFLDFAGGKIYQLTPGTGPFTAGFADKLSATGCADPRDAKAAVAGMIPYEINAPLWTDDAVKRRWLSLPEGKTVAVEANGHWRFPIGSVMRKDFYLNGRIIETRLLARHGDGGWGVYTYAWDNQQVDAQLLLGGGEKTIDNQTWVFPSAANCFFCHSGLPGRSLGPETAQMNRSVTHPKRGSPVNQLDLFVELGILAEKPAPQRLADITSDTQNTTDRARAYLHANCGFCHQPGGNGGGDLDLRASTELAQMHICNELPQLGDLGIAGAQLLAPGQPEKSVLSLRMHTLDVSRMPPLGTKMIDDSGTAIVDAWIASLQSCF